MTEAAKGWTAVYGPTQHETYEGTHTRDEARLQAEYRSARFYTWKSTTTEYRMRDNTWLAWRSVTAEEFRDALYAYRKAVRA